MDRERFDRELVRVLGPDRVRRDEPLAPFTTFHVGGPADWFAEVRSASELTDVLAAAEATAVPVTLLGGGSNVVVADAGVRGIVIRLRLHGIEQAEAGAVRADAGVTINGLVRWMIGRGLAGLEAWAGTPGTVGGAIYGNAHWQGKNIGDLVVRVRLATLAGSLVTAARDEMGFAYDMSRIQHTKEIVVWAEFGASAGEPSALRARARASLAYRKRTQPLALPSAGCIFQNPDPAIERLPDGMPASAGALVDRAGLKGRRVGGVSISHTHANFLVNDGTATARDVRELVETTRMAVRERFGVALRDEVVFLGQF